MNTNDKQPTPQLPIQTSVMFAALFIGSAFWTGLSTLLPAVDMGSGFVWLTMLAVFTFNELLHYPVNGKAWLGVRGLTILVVGMLMSAGAALLLIIAALPLTAIGLYIRRRPPVIHLLTRLAISSGLSAVSLYALLIGQMIWGLNAPVYPLTSAMTLAASIGVILIALVGTHLLGLWLGPLFGLSPSLSDGGRDSRISEVIAVVEVIPLVLVAEALPPLVFSLLTASVIVSSMNERRVYRQERSLQLRSDDMSGVNELGQRLAAHLILEDVLSELVLIMDQLIEIKMFFVVLYDPENPNMLQYILVCVDHTRKHEGYYSLKPNSVEALLLERNDVIHLRNPEWDESKALTLEGVKIDDFNAFLGLPLSKHDRLIGIFGLADDTREQFSDYEIDLMGTVAGQVGLAIENARLYTSRAQLTDNLSRINDSVQTLLFNLDSADAVQTICETAQHITKSDAAAVFLLNRDANMMELAHGIDVPDVYVADVQQRSFQDDNLSPRVMRDLVYENTTAKQMRWVDAGFRAIAETFLTSGSAVTGLLVVFHEHPYDYPTTELDLLQVLSNQITVALENAELLRALEQYASEMAQLVHLSRTSIVSLQPAEVAASAVNTLRQMFAMSSAIISIIEDVPDGNHVITVPGHIPQNIRTPDRKSLNLYPELKDMRDQVVPPRAILNLDDAQLSRGMRQLLIHNEEKTLVAVPMKANDDVFGFVLLGCTEHRQFSDREWQFMETATNLTAAQLQNAQMYNATRRALVRRLEQLSFIEMLVQQISGSLDIDRISQSILDATVRVTQAETVTLVQRVGRAEFRLIERSQRPNAPASRDEVVSHLEGPLLEVFKTGEMILSPAYGLKLEGESTPLLGRYPSLLAVPLIEKKAVMGVLCVESSTRNFFTHEQAKFLQNLAAHMVISISNARLMRERREQVDMLSQLRQLSLRVAGVDNRSMVGTQIVETSLRMLNGKDAVLYHYDSNSDDLRILTASWHMFHHRREALTVVPQVTKKRAVEILKGGQVRVIRERSNGKVQQTLVLVPMIRGMHINDLLVVFYQGNYPVSRRDLEAIELLGNQATGHLESVVLYEEVQSNSNRTRAILESTHDGILLLDRENHLLDYNTTAEKMLDIQLEPYKRQSFDGLPVKYTENQRDAVPRGMMERPDKIDTGNAPMRRTEMTMNRDDGSVFYLERTELPVRDAKNEVMGRLLVLRDITEEKEIVKYRDEIIYMLVHDLRSPLGSVISGLQFANDLSKEVLEDLDVEDLPDTTAATLGYLPEVIDLSMRSSNRLMNLINTLLDVERDQMTMMTGSWAVDALVNEAYQDLSQAAAEVKITLERQIEPDLPPLEVDGEKIQRVLINLIDNALDYSKSRVIVHVAREPEKDWVRFVVSDDGPGIPPEKRAAVFGKFTQIDGQEKRRGKHSGIGLTYCRRAILAHQGEIWVADPSDDFCLLPGACFAFRLPIRQPVSVEQGDSINE